MLSLSNAVKPASLEQQVSYLPNSCSLVDISCHSKVSNLGHSAGPTAAKQTVTGSNVSVKQTKYSCQDTGALALSDMFL